MRRIVLLLGMAVLIAGVWVVFGFGSTDALPVGSADDTSVGSLELDPALLEGGSVAEAEAQAKDTVADAERTVVEATAEGADAESEMLRILVVEKNSGEPVPGARVTYLDSGSFLYADMSLEEQLEYQLLSSDMEKLTQRYGKEVLASSQGVVFVPVGKKESYLQIVGRYHELYGQLNLNFRLVDLEEDKEFRLELEQDEFLLVQVLDSLGEPAIDVPLNIRPDSVETIPPYYYFSGLVRSEAPEGTARIAHLQLALRNWQRQGEESTDYILQALVAGSTEKGPTFDCLNPPEEPIVLQLPPTGRIILKTADAEGVSLRTEYGRVVLFMAPDPLPEDLASYRPRGGQQWYQQPDEDGTMRFEWVAIGKSFLATAYLSSESIREVFQGPLREGQEVSVTLMPKSKAYRVVGLVLDEEREPIANKRLRAVYGTNTVNNRSRSFVTDDEGRFSVTVGRADQEVTLERFSLMFETYGQPSDKSTAMYSLRRSMPLILGKNDLGEVVLGESPLVAAGRILVDGQVPDRELFSLQIERLHVQQRGNKPIENWNPERGMTLKFSEGGRFEIHGESQSERYRLSMIRYGGPSGGGRLDYLPLEPVEFVPGSEDLRIDLHSGGSLHATVLMDELVQINHLWLRMVPTDGKVQEEESDPRYGMHIPWGVRLYGQYSGEHEGQHTFRWGALGAGTYKLEVLPRGARSPLLTLGDIEIMAGERNKDPRLDPIDLRGRLRQIKILLEDREGRRIPQGDYGPPVVVINDKTADAELYGYNANNARVVIITAEPYLDLLVIARGYQPRELYGVREDQTVVLEPFPEVLVRITDGLSSLPKDHSLRVSLRNKERTQDQRKLMSDYSGGARMDQWLNPSSMLKAVDGKGEVAIQVHGDGQYSVSVMLRNNATRRTVTIDAVEPSTVAVRTSAGTQVFEIQIPEESLKQALEKAAKKR